MNKEREIIYLTEEELEDFDFTGGSQWELNGEVYDFVEEIRTDKYSDGPSWDIVVKRNPMVNISNGIVGMVVTIMVTLWKVVIIAWKKCFKKQ